MNGITGPITLNAKTAVSESRLVKMNGSQVEHNTETSTDEPVAVSQYAFGADEDGALDTLNKAGTIGVSAAGAITAGAKVYAAAAGQIQAIPTAAATYREIGTAVEAAAAADEIIQIIPCRGNVTVTVSE